MSEDQRAPQGNSRGRGRNRRRRGRNQSGRNTNQPAQAGTAGQAGSDPGSGPGQPGRLVNHHGGKSKGGNRNSGNREQRGGKGFSSQNRSKDTPNAERTPTVVKPEKPEPPFKHITKRYSVAFYETFQAAKSDLEALKVKAMDCDQLNIVIRAEGNMDDPELNSLGNVKVFAGTAWALIHDRRVADGWYDEPR